MITGLAGARRGSKLPRDWPGFASIPGNAISLFLVKYLFNVTLLPFLLKELCILQCKEVLKFGAGNVIVEISTMVKKGRYSLRIHW